MGHGRCFVLPLMLGIVRCSTSMSQTGCAWWIFRFRSSNDVESLAMCIHGVMPVSREKPVGSHSVMPFGSCWAVQFSNISCKNFALCQACAGVKSRHLQHGL